MLRNSPLRQNARNVWRRHILVLELLPLTFRLRHPIVTKPGSGTPAMGGTLASDSYHRVVSVTTMKGSLDTRVKETEETGSDHEGTTVVCPNNICEDDFACGSTAE